MTLGLTRRREGAKFFSNNWINIFWLTRDWPHMMFLKQLKQLKQYGIRVT